VRLLAAALAVLMVQATAPMRTIARGDQSGVDAARQAVARTAAEWAALWRQHAPAQPPPAVDFPKEMVVAVFLGTRNTGGYSVEILGAETDQGALVVRYRHRSPSPDAITAQVITMPFHIVAIPAGTADVKFQRVQ
jgi:PrcB C-terminal